MIQHSAEHLEDQAQEDDYPDEHHPVEAHDLYQFEGFELTDGFTVYEELILLIVCVSDL